MESVFSTFVISETTVNQVYSLPEELQIKFFKAITDYGLYGIEPDFIGMENTVWIGIRDLILHTKRKDEKWRKKQQENGKRGGRPKNPEEPTETQKTQDNPDEPNENIETHNDNKNDNDNEFTTAIAVTQKKIVSKRKQELTDNQKPLFHAARLCFESSEKAKAIMYQDKETTSREMKHLKTFVIRCENMAPNITADFMITILEHFKVMCNGKYRGKMTFNPQCLITPWVWALVIDSLPEKESPETKEIIRGLFK